MTASGSGTARGIGLTSTAAAGWSMRVTITSWIVSGRIVDRGAVRTVWRVPAVIKWKERVTTRVGVVEPYPIPARKRIAREPIEAAKHSKRRVQAPVIDTAVGFRQHLAALFTPNVYFFTFAGLFLFFGEF